MQITDRDAPPPTFESAMTASLDAPHPPAAMQPAVDPGQGWIPLPDRARMAFVLGALGPAFAIACAFSVMLALLVLRDWLPAPLVVGAALAVTAPLALGIAILLGLRVHRTLRWRFDANGLSVRRGVMWQRETHVPITRVQHLDISRGPLQRRRRLSTLVLHTAGTRSSAVSVPHLDVDDAERLRDALARQHDDDDAG